MVDTPLVTDEVTVLVGVVGSVRGVVMYTMAEKTARKVVSAMVGEPVPLFDAMAESAIAEMGNVITGTASIKLEAAGHPCNIAPPTVIVGKNTSISTLGVQRLLIPIITPAGEITIHVALRGDR